MIIPQKETAKFKAFNEKLGEFVALNGSLQFKSHYSPKFKNILMSSSAKLVGCDAKILINKREDGQSRYYQKEYVLTRQGLKESFGYTGDFKARFMDGDHWIHDYVKNDYAIAGLVKLLKDAQVKYPDGLRLHLQAMKDIAALEIDNESYQKLAKLTSEISIFGDIEKGNEEESSKTTEMILSTSGGYNSKNLVFAVPGTVRAANSRYNAGGLEADEILTIGHQASFINFLRISEEPTYSILMDLLNKHIALCTQHIKDKSAAAEAVCNKYGQYLVYTEL